MRKRNVGSAGKAALRSSALALVLLASAGAAHAQAVSRIVVEGNQRIDDQTVRDYLTIKPGQAATASRLDDSLKALFATGLFEDVELTRQGGALVVRVTENAVINAINVEGNRRIKDDAIEAVIQSRSQGALSRNQVQADVQRVLDLYRARGRFNAVVTPQVIPVGQGRVNLAFVVQEGRKVGVKRINFIGNERYGDGTLRSKLRTTESNLLSFLKTSDVYNPAVFEADQEALRKFYLNNGYADFRIISAVADYDAADEAFYITYTIEEGDRYEIGAVDIESNIANLPGEELRREVRTDPGDRYDAEDVDKTLEDMTLAVAERGYAFGQVRPRGFRDPETDRVNITYVVEEGPRVYVERINIVGNTRTQDFVIRREFDLAEGDAYNRVLVDRAERRLNNLKYFKRVRIVNEQGSEPDRVVINVFVEEDSTGNIGLGGGYSTGDGFVIDASLTERNFLGRGQQVKIGGSLGEERRSVDFSFTEPYFLGRRISAGFDVFYREQDLQDVSSYNYELYGAGIRFGLPITEDLGLQLRYRLSQISIEDVPDTASPIILQYDDETFLSSAVGYSLVYSTLDSTVSPRNGFYASFGQDLTGLGGDVNLINTAVDLRAYREVYPDIIGFLKLTGGHVSGFGDQEVRTFDGFTKGGETVRGFKSGGISPRSVSFTAGIPDGFTGGAVGATGFAAATAEVQFPLGPLTRTVGIRGAAFADAGTTFGQIDVPECYDTVRRVEVQNTDKAACIARPGAPGQFVFTDVIGTDAALRASVGASLIWESPFGPLRVDAAYPIAEEDFDETQIVRFGAYRSF